MVPCQDMDNLPNMLSEILTAQKKAITLKKSCKDAGVDDEPFLCNTTSEGQVTVAPKQL